jgi:hypothetical protein
MIGRLQVGNVWEDAEIEKKAGSPQSRAQRKRLRCARLCGDHSVLSCRVIRKEYQIRPLAGLL